jgi:tryptophan-rich sensory protein
MATETKPSPYQSYAMPVIAVLICVAAWVLGGVLTRPNLDWYATLQKPGFTPPNETFPVAWTILYALMAVSAWLVWRAPGKEEDRRIAFNWFFNQLAIGVVWSYAFFSG